MDMKMEEVPDPLIDDVRERRRQLWAKHHNNIDEVYETIKAFQSQHPEKLRDPSKLKTRDNGVLANE